jgi:hypothetical protein
MAIQPLLQCVSSNSKRKVKVKVKMCMLPIAIVLLVVSEYLLCVVSVNPYHIIVG